MVREAEAEAEAEEIPMLATRMPRTEVMAQPMEGGRWWRWYRLESWCSWHGRQWW